MGNGPLDSTEIQLPCECGATVTTTVGAVRDGSAPRCPNGHVIAVDATELDVGLSRADRAMAKLERRFRQMGD